MARLLGPTVLLVALVVLGGIGFALPGAPATSSPRSNNDAGSGQDAGDLPELALPLGQTRRAWQANLTPPGTDADWYRLETSGAFCALAEITPSVPGELTLAGSTSREPAATYSIDGHRPSRIALAAGASATPYLGLEPAPFASNMLVDEDRRTPAPPNPGRYSFSLGTFAHGDLDPEGDGEWPEAGATDATAAPLPLDCSSGRLGGEDAEDRYHFDVQGARALTISFTVADGAAAQMRVLTPSGAEYGATTGGAISVGAFETGRWTVVIGPAPQEGGSSTRALALGALPLPAPTTRTLTSASSGTSYLLGTTEDPGLAEPCRPACTG